MPVSDPPTSAQTPTPRPLETNHAPPRCGDVPSAPTESQIEKGARPPRFAALRHRNFRLFWAGNVLSNTGTFAQQAAQGWLVRSLTPDSKQAATNLALVAACGTLPILIFTLYAGVLADRVDKRRALLVTNALSALIAVVLTAIVALKIVQVWHLALLSAATGIVTAFDIPIRQSFNHEMVAPQDLPNAIALNSSGFNAARVIGPAVGGVLLRIVGMAACFGTNALSYVAMLIALSAQKLPVIKREPRAFSVDEVRQGVAFVRDHAALRVTTILIAFVSLTTMSFGTLLPIFARDIFHTQETGFAALMTCNGLGALGSAVALAVAGQMRHKGKRLLLGSFGFCLSVFAFSLSPNLVVACAWLIVAGWFLLTFLMTANTLVQTTAPPELSGRVFSIYSLALIGTAPIGAILIGALARSFGARHAVGGCALLAALFTLGVFVFNRQSLWKEK